MTSTVTMEGVKKAVFFPFKGEKWGTKLLIGSVITLAFYIPVVGIAAAIVLAGYFGQIMKRVIVAEEDPELPDWKEWETLFLDGIKIAGASLIYMLPGLLCMVAGYILFLVLDIAFVATTSSMNSYSSSFPAAFVGNMVGMFVGLGLVGVGALLMLVMSIFLPPALGNLIDKDNFGAAFRIKEWWPVLRANIGGYLLAIALLIGTNSLMIMVTYCLYFTVILCILIPFSMCICIYILGSMAFSLYAVSYRDGTKKLAGVE